MKKPGEYVELFRSMAKEWKWLLRYVTKYRMAVVFYVIVGLIGTAMGLGSSVASKYLIDSVVSHDTSTIVTSAAFFIGMSLAQIFLNAITSRISSSVGTKVSSDVRSNIYEHIVLSRWEKINKFHSGELINRLEGDVSSVSNSIISFIPSVFTRTATFVGCFCIVLYYDPAMAVIALISAPVMFLLSRVSAKMMRKFNEQSRELNGKVLSFSSESIQNLQTLKAFDLTRQHADQFRTLLENYRTLRMNHDKFSILLSMVLSIVGLIAANLCYGWGVWRLWQGVITYGTMTLFLQLSGRLSASFSALVGLVPGAISIATAAGRVMEVADLPLETDDNRETAEAMMPAAKQCGISIQANGLSYTYANAETPVLRNASFSADPGETIAFVGPSGEGKTTLLRLLLGLVQPQDGQLTMQVPGRDPLTVSDSTRRFCSYVPQGSAVFSGTVADNLRIVRPNASEAELIQALQTADAWSFVEPLPDGIHTVIGERGINFSEGQIQRISIARALLRQAPVLILDEATSALDEATESRVLKSLMQENPHRTCILTTHRPSMLQYCTRIYRVSEQGVLLEQEKERDL